VIPRPCVVETRGLEGVVEIEKAMAYHRAEYTTTRGTFTFVIAPAREKTGGDIRPSSFPLSVVVPSAG
jgi:hypothetical protein